MPITMPTKPDVITPQPAPKIGHMLGRGSLAIKKGDILEVLDPAGKTVARGTVDGTVLWPPRPWSPQGNALIYSNHAALRVLDFAAGADRFLASAPPGRLLFPPYYWIEGGAKILFHAVPGDKPPTTAWIVGIDGQGMRQLSPVPPDATDVDYVTDILVTDVSHDGGEVLFHGEKYSAERGSEGSVVFRMDLATRKAVRVSPSSQSMCSGGRFINDGKQIVMNCLQKVASGPLPSDVYLVGQDGSNPRKLASGQPMGFFVVGASHDGRFIALAEGLMFGRPETKEAIYVLDTVDGTTKLLFEASPGKVLRPLGFSVDDRSFLIVIRDSAGSNGTLVLVDTVTIATKVVADSITDAFLAE